MSGESVLGICVGVSFTSIWFIAGLTLTRSSATSS